MLFGFAKALLLPDDDDDDVVVVVVVAGRCYSCRFFAEAKRIFVPVREVAVGIVMCPGKRLRYTKRTSVRKNGKGHL